MYARIYFPTYTNGLKEIAGSLGFRWSDRGASGLSSLMWRHKWEESKDDQLKQKLIVYNEEDCAALQQLVGTLAEYYIQGAGDPDKGRDHVDVESLERDDPYRFLFQKNEFALPELEQINQAAYWDYQRDKVYLKSSTRLKRVACMKARGAARSAHVPDAHRDDLGRPSNCPRCAGTSIQRHERAAKTVLDLKFSQTGVKRWNVRYHSYRFVCWHCKKTFLPDRRPWNGGRLGSNLVAYLVYQVIELQLPQRRICASAKELLNLSISSSQVSQLKGKTSHDYQATYEGIISKIVNGTLVHADETRIALGKREGYVWVLTNLEEVAYFYTETRDGKTVQDLLSDFKGVLVSDFYAVYDSLKCPQQKCLIHLARDLNDDLLGEPFNEELRRLVSGFAMLVRPMVATIDCYGLKSRFLRKHKPGVFRFYEELVNTECRSTTAESVKRRLIRNREKLFTFLDYDGVPWNNNNAEHAIKAFATLRRRIDGLSSAKGLREYLTLLSISETCKYKEVSFLQFLRSGLQDVDTFISGQGATYRR
jgi:transposase IS66 family protein/RNase H-like protein